MAYNREQFVENREKVIAALKGKWPMAEWVDKDDWDEYHCSRCRAWGNIEDHFCGKCGSFMKNYEPEKRYHYNCKHCGANLDDVGSYTIVPPDSKAGDPQAFTFICPACGKESTHTFEDASVEIKDDGFNERFLEQLDMAAKGVIS